MVEPSFWAETCTPSSFWPEAEVIEPVSNWSAEAVLTAPTRTTPATLANNWHRKFVMMFLSSSRLLGSRIGALERWLGTVNRRRAPRPADIPFTRIVRVTTRFSKEARAKWRQCQSAHAEPQVRRNNYIQRFSLPIC